MSAAALQAVLNDPRYHDYLAILKGARNGFVYGVKVRFPHALIMAILFGRGEYVSKALSLSLSLSFVPLADHRIPISSTQQQRLT
jgi:hypothetical protein